MKDGTAGLGQFSAGSVQVVFVETSSKPFTPKDLIQDLEPILTNIAVWE